MLVPFTCRAVVALIVGAASVPVNVGLASGANKFNAVWVAVDIGLLASEVLLTLPRPTMAAVMPLTVPVNVGLAFVAYEPSVVVRLDEVI
jgi:hypothetical protein